MTAVAVTDESADSPQPGVRWLAFAAALLAVSGIFKILDALWAFKYDDEVSDQVQSVLFERDLGSYGWLWLIVGIVLIITGFAVMQGSAWARWLGIIVASLAAISYFTYIYYQPFAALTMVMLSILVIFALAIGGESRGGSIY